MNTKKFFKRFAVLASTAVFSLSTIQSAYAAPGNLATAPLFLSTIVEPNVFFTLDDSGSMDWDLVVEDTTANTGNPVVGSLPTDDAGNRIAYLESTWTQLYSSSKEVLRPSDAGNAAWDKYWVFRNFNGNKLYYNPSTVYTPWPGSQAGGSPMYLDADPTNALKDPNDPAGDSVDLTVAQTTFAPYWRTAT